MGLVDKLKQMRANSPLVNTEAERQLALFIKQYQALRAQILDWLAPAFVDGDVVMEELKDNEIEDSVLGIRKVSAFLLRFPVVGRRIVVEPWGLTHRTPVWALLQIYPINALFNEHWVGLQVPPDQALSDSTWVDIGEELKHEKLTTHENKGFFKINFERVIDGYLGDAGKK